MYPLKFKIRALCYFSDPVYGANNPQNSTARICGVFIHTWIGQHRLFANAYQVGVPAIACPSTTFKRVEIELPSLKEQERIVAILNFLSDIMSCKHPGPYGEKPQLNRAVAKIGKHWYN